MARWLTGISILIAIVIAAGLVAGCAEIVTVSSLPTATLTSVQPVSPSATGTATAVLKPPQTVPLATRGPTDPIQVTPGRAPAPGSPLTPCPDITPAEPWEGDVLTLTIVFDNHTLAPQLRSGWGFAAWLEYGAHTVLFDTGADGAALLDNLRVLGLDPKAVDVVILSHNHGDHTGGLMAVLAVNPQVSVYLPQSFPSQFKKQVRATGASVVEVDAPLEILPGLWSTGEMGRDIAEQALIVETVQGSVVVTGCAHPGVEVMVGRTKEVVQGPIQLVVGGFHLGGASRRRVQEIIDEFRRLGVREVAPCHCTGDAATAQLCQAFGQECTLGVGWTYHSRIVGWEPSSQGIPAQVGIADMAVAPSDPRVVYLAAYEPGGLYRSTDGGDSWQAARGDIESLAPLTVAVHPTNPDVAWVGTVVGGYGTTDGGRQWQPLADLPVQPLYALAVAPDGGALYAGGEESGIWRSNDGGSTWAAGNTSEIQASILSLGIGADGSVFAGTAGQGLWISRDRGMSWQVGGGELAGTYVPKIAVGHDGSIHVLASGSLYTSPDGDGWQSLGPQGFVALSFGLSKMTPDDGGATGDRLYLGSKGDGLAVSGDGGQTWTVQTSEFRHADITCLVADPSRPTRAFLGTRYHGLHRTEDGQNWALISGTIGQPVISALAQHPKDPQVFYAGTLDGVYCSDDSGAHWRLASGAMGKLLVQALAIDPTGEVVYAGADSGIYSSWDGGATWRWAEQDTGGIAVLDIVVDPHDANRVYAGSWGHNVLLSVDGGQAWTPIHNGLETLSVHAFAIDLSDPRVLYAGTVEAIYRSEDGGNSWRAGAMGGRPLTTFALIVDPRDPARLYAGTTEGVYGSTDGGETWQPAGANSLAGTVTALALMPGDGCRILAGTERYGLFVSADGGFEWQPAGMEGASVYAVLIDREGAVWLGTDRGIFKSR